MHWYKRNMGDYAKRTSRLTLLEHGVYTLLIDACCSRQRFPTEAEAIKWVWADSDDEIQAVRFVLSRLFTLKKDKYIDPEISALIVNYRKTAKINKQIAIEREANKRKAADADAGRGEHGPSSTVNDPCATVNEQPPNQEPGTKSQEPANRIKGKKSKMTKASGLQSKTAAEAVPVLSVEDLVSEGVDPEHAAAWFCVRRDKRLQSLTVVAWQDLKACAARGGISAAQAVHVCAAKSWLRFEPEWSGWRSALGIPEMPAVSGRRQTPASKMAGAGRAIFGDELEA